MTESRSRIHLAALYVAPLVVAWWGWSMQGAAVLVLLLLAWRWAIALSTFAAPEHVPELELQAISASHFVEKVRWCMDRAGLAYIERQSGGTLGAFFTGRTVPSLKVRTGAVRSSIGNSPEILRFLWGRYAATHGDQAAFLEPTRERLALEERIDRRGVALQVWVYYHLLNDRQLTLQVWGRNNPNTPFWQRTLLALLFPLLRAMIRRSFRINDKHYASAVASVSTLLDDAEHWLEDGRQSLLGGSETNFTDVAFAAINGLWLQPAGYGAGKADATRIERDQLPAQMRADVERWERDYPRSTAFINRLYDDFREPLL
ncbi:MAG: hypothetical protein AAFN78_13365 [Pseudomonadota bacterium]